MTFLLRFFSVFALFYNHSIPFNHYPTTQVWENKIYKKNIKTVVIHKKEWELSFPIIKLNSDEKIHLEFDEIGTSVSDYSYSIIHCKANWQQSDLNPIEYMDGYQEIDLAEYSFSQNTLVNYVNYSVEFPNKEFQLLKSGNYIVKVYDRNNPDNIILARRFYVLDELVAIDAFIDRLNVQAKNGLNQRLNIELDCKGEIENPTETLLLKVQKNNGHVKEFTHIKPSFFNGEKLKYQAINGLAFAGGNEFRHFDIKNFRFISDRLLAVDKKADINHVYLRPDINKAEKEYRFKPDINGKRTVKLENNDKSSIMADYCYVYFQLEAPIPLQKGDYYIYGALTDWDYQEEAKMEYDFKKECFRGKLYLKQGYYNYQYHFKSTDEMFDKEESVYEVEGNFFNAENEYHIMVYYKDYSTSFERLVGYFMTNSTKSANY